MLCKEMDGWCAYWIGGRCVADDMWAAHHCQGVEPVPLWMDSWKVIGLLDRDELNAQMDVAETIIKKAQPIDTHNPIDGAVCDQVKAACQMFLEIIAKFTSGVFKKGDDIFSANGVDGEEVLDEKCRGDDGRGIERGVSED